jgi:hypothetical protein
LGDQQQAWQGTQADAVYCGAAAIALIVACTAPAAHAVGHQQQAWQGEQHSLHVMSAGSLVVITAAYINIVFGGLGMRWAINNRPGKVSSHASCMMHVVLLCCALL